MKSIICELNIYETLGENQSFIASDLNETDIAYFSINVAQTPDNLKIIIEGSNNNYIISFYQQDSSFQDRKQIVEGSTQKTEMWLNKKQIGKEFYFTVECLEKTCSFHYSINVTNYLDLEIGETYSYYVDQKTEIMNFNIRINSDIIKQNSSFFTIWAKGSKQISTKLNGEKDSTNSSYNVFIKKENTNYTLEVTGKQNDLITVGALLFEDNSTKVTCSNCEYTGVINKNYADKNCFIIGELTSISYIVYNKKLLNLDFYENNTFCLNNVYYNDEQVFYSIQFIQNRKINNNTFYAPQLVGETYFKAIKKSEIVQLIPYIPNLDSVQYLSYHIQKLQGNLNVSLYECENYPKCTLNESKDINSLQDINGYTFFYEKEFKDFSYLNKKQKVLSISCSEGTKNYINSTRNIIKVNEEFCFIGVSISIRPDDEFVPKELFPDYRYIKKHKKEKFILGYQTNPKKEYIALNLEIFYGNVTLELNKSFKSFNVQRKNLFLINDEKANISIMANENSFYSISYLKKNYNDDKDLVFFGGNNIFNLTEKSNNTLDLMYYPKIMDNNNNFIYTGFYPIGCEIDVSIKNENRILKNNNNSFYQDYFLLNGNTNNETFMRNYFINKTRGDNCKYYISSFLINNISSKEGIILTKDFSQAYIINNWTYIYPLIIENEVIIEFLGLSNEAYDISLLINDEIFNYPNPNITKLKENKELIIIKKDDYKGYCNSDNQVCKLSFNIKPSKNNQNISIIVHSFKEYNEKDNYDNEDFSGIIIKNNGENNDKPEKSDPDDDNILVLILITVGAILIFIIAIAFAINYILKKKKENEDLRNKVITTSFVDDGKENDNENET